MGYDHRWVLDNQVEVVKDERSGLWVREGTTDSQIIREMPAYAPIGVQPGETVLDLGGNIGGYVVEAIDNQKAGRVVVFEPDPYNFNMLERNTEKYPKDQVLAFQAAILGKDRGTLVPDRTDGLRQISFFKNNRKCKASHSTIEFKGRERIDITGYEFDTIVNAIQPDRIKVDIEGEEHHIFRTCVLPPCVKGIIMELHLNKDDWRSVGLEAIDQNILKQGFKHAPGREPKNTGANWHTLVVWRRDI